MRNDYDVAFSLCSHVEIVQDGLTALRIASESGHVDCVRVLAEAGADVNSASRVSE